MQQEVINELHNKLHVYNVDVSVKHGFVLLKSKMLPYDRKRVVEKVIKGIDGIVAIIEETENQSQEVVKADEELATNVMRQLYTDKKVPENDIIVRVSGGNVYLEGEVEWGSQRSRIGRAVMNTEGMKAICNLIRLKSKRIEPDTLRQRL